ncbi:MAG: NAD(P)H-binding protein [Candidatus Cybelea sp.]
MKLLLLGATGRTGRWVLEYALAAGHDVVALVRTPEKILAHSTQLSIVRGTPESAGDVLAAICGSEAVISTLNNNRESDLPWARPLSPPMLMTRSIANAVSAMRSNDVRRIVTLSALGVGDSFVYAPAITRLLIHHTNLRIVYEDHEAQEALLRTSGLDWTCARAAILTNRRSRQLLVSCDGRPKPALTIGRAELARFMVDILDQPTFFGKAPVISGR